MARRRSPSRACVSSRFQKLLAIAQDEVALTLDALPARLQPSARALPVTYQAKPNALLLDDGVDEDTLGLFVGDEYAHAELGSGGMPSQILLFMENIWDMAEGEEEFFREEVRTTFLHELGHYLGLDERDLEERGLE
jgi:predicted Zn-dependent protease with MMP-like domain